MRTTSIAKAAAFGCLIAGPAQCLALPKYAIFEITPPQGYAETVAFGLSTDTTVVGDAIDGSARIPVYYSGSTIPSRFVDPLGLTAIEGHRSTVGQNLTTGQAVYVPWVGGVQQIVSGATSSYGVAINDRGHSVGVANLPIANSFDTIPNVFRFVPSTNETTYPLAYARPGAIDLPGYVACMVDHSGSADDGNLVILDPNDKLIRPIIPGYLQHEMPSGIASNKFRVCGTALYKPIGATSNFNQAFLLDEFGKFWTLPDPKKLNFPTDANAIDFWGELVVGKTEVGAANQYATAWEVDPTNPFNPYISTDLNTLIPANSNWQLDEATGVNSVHAICGWGHRVINGKNVRRGFLMLPINLDNFYCDPSTVVAGQDSTGTVSLTQPNSIPTTLTLQSNNPAVVLPAKLQIPTLTSSAQFIIQTRAVAAPTKVTLSASYSNLVKSVYLTVLPATPVKVAFQHASVKGGQTIIGAFVFNGPVASPQTVSLSSGTSDLQVPATTTVATNTFLGTFVAHTKMVTKNESAVLTAVYNGNKYVTAVIITP